MIDKVTFKRLGKACARFRTDLGYTQEEVADWVGCCKSHVSAFEIGRTRSTAVLLWYIYKGFSSEEVRRILNDG